MQEMQTNSQPVCHAPLFDRALSASMGRSVIDHLAKLVQLPASGCIAGQSVMSTLMALYASGEHRGQSAPIKDVDVFYRTQDRLVESGFLTEPGAHIGDYDRLLKARLNIQSVQTLGQLNLIEQARGRLSPVDCPPMSDTERLDTVLDEFDLTLVQVGVDLKTAELRWTPGFASLARGEPVQARDIGLAERSWMRYQKKRQQMPWLSWDHAQIKSAVQLSQIRTFAISAGDEKGPETMRVWRELPWSEHLDLLTGPARLQAVWHWPACSTHLDALAVIECKRGLGRFDLTAKDAVLFDALVVNLRGFSHFGLTPLDLTSNLLAQAKDGLNSLIARHDTEELQRYIEAGGSLLDGANADELRLGRRSLLIHTAIKARNPTTVSWLLDAGFSPNDRSSRLGATAYLALWCSMSNYEPGEKLEKSAALLARMRQMGADVSLAVGPSSTVLHTAAWQVGKRWLTHEMPHHAEHTGLANAWGELPGELDTSVDWSKKVFGMTPARLHSLDITKKFMTACQTGCLHSVQLALACGVSANKGLEVTPLFESAYQGHVDVVRALLQAGADSSVQEQNGRTALMVAARQGHVSVLKALVQAGANIDQTDNDGDTALVYAARGGHIGSVDFLIQQGACVQAVLANGERLIENMASLPHHTQVLAALADAMATALAPEAMDAILSRAKASAARCGRGNNVAVLDSLLAKLHIAQLLDQCTFAARCDA